MTKRNDPSRQTEYVLQQNMAAKAARENTEELISIPRRAYSHYSTSSFLRHSLVWTALSFTVATRTLLGKSLALTHSTTGGEDQSRRGFCVQRGALSRSRYVLLSQ